jgi:hypothetical protein
MKVRGQEEKTRGREEREEALTVDCHRQSPRHFKVLSETGGPQQLVSWEGPKKVIIWLIEAVQRVSML